MCLTAMFCCRLLREEIAILMCLSCKERNDGGIVKLARRILQYSTLSGTHYHETQAILHVEGYAQEVDYCSIYSSEFL